MANETDLYGRNEHSRQPGLVRGLGRLGRRRHRCRHHDRHGNFSEAERNGGRRTIRVGRVRGVDCRGAAFALWRDQLRRTGRVDSGGRRGVCLSSARVRARVGILVRLDAFNCGTPRIRGGHCRGIAAILRLSGARHHCAALCVPPAAAHFYRGKTRNLFLPGRSRWRLPRCAW